MMALEKILDDAELHALLSFYGKYGFEYREWNTVRNPTRTAGDMVAIMTICKVPIRMVLESLSKYELKRIYAH